MRKLRWRKMSGKAMDKIEYERERIRNCIELLSFSNTLDTMDTYVIQSVAAELILHSVRLQVFLDLEKK